MENNITLHLDEPLFSKIKVIDLHFFFDLIDEFDIQDKEDYATFMSVIKEHCLDKNIYDFDMIKHTWENFKNSIKNITNNIV